MNNTASYLVGLGFKPRSVIRTGFFTFFSHFLQGATDGVINYNTNIKKHCWDGYICGCGKSGARLTVLLVAGQRFMTPVVVIVVVLVMVVVVVLAALNVFR